MLLSVAMMVKNESANLPRLLASLQRIAVFDEIVIVDTGSTDDTVEIARAAGARVIIPDDIDSLFIETQYGRALNFSAARNLSVEHATGDWLFLVDADEEVIGTAAGIREWLETLDPQFDAACVRWQDWKRGEKFMEFLPPRFFRRGCVKYVNIVHNRPTGFREPIAMYPGDLLIKHYGYDLEPQAAEAKKKRTVGLLLKQLEMDPASWWCHFYLAQAFGELQDIERTIEHCVTYIEHRADVAKFNPSVWFTLCQALLIRKDEALADKWIPQAIRELPEDMDIACAVIDYGAWRQKPNVMVAGCEMYLTAAENIERDRLAGGARFIYNHNPKKLSMVLFHLGLLRLEAARLHLNKFTGVVAGIDDRRLAEVATADLRRELQRFRPMFERLAEPQPHEKVIDYGQAKAARKKQKPRGKRRNCKRGR